jgi:hypothetical protein
MLLNITTTHQPATDLGYLLHKHPDKFQSVELSVGKAHIFYPEVTESRTTISLLLDIDPIEMIRSGRKIGGEGFALGHYVNDRPYVASSFMSVAIAKAFSTALNGRCNDKPELVNQPLPFEVTIGAVPAPKGGESLVRSFFEPLGYQVELQSHPLDSKFPQWGMLPTAYKVVNLQDEESYTEAVNWWVQMTTAGGEGMVVKPYDFISYGSEGLLQPAIKCRGSEYLRIIYGPEYDVPANLERLKNRYLNRKQSLAIREFALGVEGLERFVNKEPLRKVHECVFGVLALESEEVDPRL